MTDDTSLEARNYSANAVLRDGGSIHIRAIRADDKDRLLDHFRHMSQDSIYHRFFGLKRSLSDQDLVRFTEIDFITHMALVATLLRDGGERFIGVGQYVTTGPASAEVAFAVLDEHQGRGVGAVLLDHLGRVARAAGITEFQADVLGDNNRMLEVFAKSGFRVKRSTEAGVVHLSFPTVETEASRQASELRNWAAAGESIRKLLHPRSVAVVGASRSREKLGGSLIANLLRAGFNGPVYPVNPAASELMGLRCYPSVSAVGAPVDLALIAVPAELVHGAIEDCARARVHGVVVITSGFAEISPQGRAEEERLFETVRASGMRMVGPNCMGVLNTDPLVRLDATFAPTAPPPGNIGMYSQSGALGIAILDYMNSRGLGISTFVSAGNRSDVSNNDLLAYWLDDARTAVVVLYLESVGNPRKFARLAPEVARRRPIVAVKSGRSAAGRRAASRHSAALANLDVAVEALFEQAGVIRTNTLMELFDVVAMLSTQPVPAGPRVGVVTNAGGPGILLADACEAQGLILPRPGETTVDTLRSFLPARASLGNPVDLTATAGPAEYERAIAAVGADPNVDSVVAVYIPVTEAPRSDVTDAIARGAAQVPAHKPVLTVFLSSHSPPAVIHAGARGQVPSYAFPENAAMVLAAACRYARWRERPRGMALELNPFAMGAVRAVVDRALGDADGPIWLAPEDIATILRAAGIELALAESASVADAPQVADRIGYPLVAKVIAPGITHKSDIGGVIMGLNSAIAVAEAAVTLADRVRTAGAVLEGVLLQREVRGGIEALVGVTTDPTFGPLVVCGLGGVMVELIHDVAFRLTPVTDIDAQEMMASLKTGRLLDGYRGAVPGDREALAAVLQRVSALIEAIPELTEMDLNPVKVLPPGKGAVVVDARMRLRPTSRRI
ncbi:MAG TPA: GNAT family N-acetyltransferase [Candidatus Binataceae bacterium]|nr:GNAT family N-acetyltransferase [Candidatus Binataceae bacterium]